MSGARITLHPKLHRPQSFSLIETHWGYILREHPSGLGVHRLIDAGLRFFGIVLVMTAYAQWLVPAGLYQGNPLASKVVLAVVLSVGGCVMYLFAANRGRLEAQIDTSLREVRLARTRRNRPARIKSRIPFDQIESVFVERHAGKPAELYLRRTQGAADVRLVSGAGREMNLLHARLCRDLTDPVQRLEMRLGAVQPTDTKLIRLRRIG